MTKKSNMKNKTAIFYITDKGYSLAQKLKGLYPDADVVKFKSEVVSEGWSKSKNLIFIMASGIVVRAIAPLIKNKKVDPAVVVLDEKGEYAISLLSGHIGGANRVANEIAGFLKGKAVITTASDVNNMPSIDLWARENDLVIENWDALPHTAARFLNNRKLKVYSDIEITMPKEFGRTDKPKSADFIITNKNYPFTSLYLRPKNLIIGIGCNSKTPAEEIEDAVKKTLRKKSLSFLSIHSIATIDKKCSEPGLVAFAKRHNLEIKAFTADEINSAISHQPSAISISSAAFKATGAYAVSEPAALLASGADKLLVQKQKKGNVTIAIAEIKPEVGNQSSRPSFPQAKRVGNPSEKQKRFSPLRVAEDDRTSRNDRILYTQSGHLYIVGTGPGSVEHITPYAQDAIRKSDVIVGYGTYLDLIQELIKDKEVISTGMTKEVDRCSKAVELVLSGKAVAVISGGDPGIYAMAGLVLEILSVKGSKSQRVKDSDALTLCHSDTISVEIIPGISALNACAARLGAPLMHDFASISLSDRLTPWELIEKRLDSAAKADFVIILYNPKSKGRAEHINRARAIILKHRAPETPVGIVKGALRVNESVIITTLQDLLKHDIDMQTTVIIGNSQTFTWDNWMITPRGYERKIKI